MYVHAALGHFSNETLNFFHLLKMVFCDLHMVCYPVTREQEKVDWMEPLSKGQRKRPDLAIVLPKHISVLAPSAALTRGRVLLLCVGELEDLRYSCGVVKYSSV